jgi:GT2 family glycosyltransferase
MSSADGASGAGHDAPPVVSVVIVHVGRAALLLDCLATLHASTVRTPFEAIVVDNQSGSTDIETVIEKYPTTRVLALAERLGYAAASNEGIALSRGQYVLWCNNDLQFQHGALDILSAFLDCSPDYGIASPRLLNPDGTFQACYSLLNIGPLPLAIERLGIGSLLPRFDMDRHWRGTEAGAKDVAVPAGACCLLRRTALDAVGGLDASFFLYAEEFDIAYRVREAGWRIRYVPDAVVVHTGGQTTSRVEGAATHRFVLQSWHSKFAYLRKHYGRAAEVSHAVLFAITALPRWAGALLWAGEACWRGDSVRARALRARARLHSVSAWRALSAKRADASRLPTNEDLGHS